MDDASAGLVVPGVNELHGRRRRRRRGIGVSEIVGVRGRVASNSQEWWSDQRTPDIRWS
jgi:hypothetical protein